MPTSRTTCITDASTGASWLTGPSRPRVASTAVSPSRTGIPAATSPEGEQQDDQGQSKRHEHGRGHLLVALVHRGLLDAGVSGLGDAQLGMRLRSGVNGSQRAAHGLLCHVRLARELERHERRVAVLRHLGSSHVVHALGALEPRRYVGDRGLELGITGPERRRLDEDLLRCLVRVGVVQDLPGLARLAGHALVWLEVLLRNEVEANCERYQHKREPSEDGRLAVPDAPAPDTSCKVVVELGLGGAALSSHGASFRFCSPRSDAAGWRLQVRSAPAVVRLPEPAQLRTGQRRCLPNYSNRMRLGASRMRNTRAGTPATTAFAGTSRVSTALVPITALSPTVTPRRMQAP